MDKPIIGITCSIRLADKKRRFPTPYAFEYLNLPYRQAIEKAGGIPILLPNLEGSGTIENILCLVDGLLISGGGDVLPELYHQEVRAKLVLIARQRDEFEMRLIHKASRKRIPLLGICRGMQVMNVTFGGSLCQDFRLKQSYRDHTKGGGNLYLRKHDLRIRKGTVLHSIIKKEQVTVNTSHHQMVDEVAPGFRVSAWSTQDKVIEAIEHGNGLILGVQWHPEVMRSISSIEIFRWLINQAKER